MDFNKILFLAAENKQNAEQKRSTLPALNTKFSAPKKEKKDPNIKSETLQKLLEEKEREKREKEAAERRRQEEKIKRLQKKKEEELRRQKEEEKKNRFRIPKKVQNSVGDPTSNSISDNSENKHSDSSKSAKDEKDSRNSERVSKSSKNEKDSKSSERDSKSTKTERDRKSFDHDSKSHKNSESLKDEKHSSERSKSSNSKNEKDSKSSERDSKSSKTERDRKSFDHDSKSHKNSESLKDEKHSSERSKSSKSHSSEKSSNSSSKSKHSSSRDKKSISSSDIKKSQSQHSIPAKLKSSSDIHDKIKDMSLSELQALLDGPVTYTHLKSDSGNARVVSCTSREQQIKQNLQEKLARIKGSLAVDMTTERKKKNAAPMDDFINDEEEIVREKKSKSKHKEKDRDGEKESKHSKGERKHSKQNRSDQSDQSDRTLHKHSKHKGNDQSGRSSFSLDKDKFSNLKNKLNNLDMKNKISEVSTVKESKPSAPKKPPNPAMGFSDLLKLAQVKSTEPIKFEPKIKPVKKEVEPSRLMTQEEKDREEERKERLKSKDYQDWFKYGESKKSENDKVIDKKTVNSKKCLNTTLPSTHRVESKSDEPKKSLHSKFSKSDSKLHSSSGVSKSQPKVIGKKFHIPDSEKKNAVAKVSQNSNVNGSREPVTNHKKIQISDSMKKNCVSKTSSDSNNIKKRPHVPDKVKTNGRDSPDVSEAKKRKLEKQIQEKKNIRSGKVNGDKYSSTNENVLVCGPSKDREKPSKPMKIETNNPWDRIYGEINKDRPKPVKRKPQDFLNDSESEYDEEMDDFIVDEEEEEEDMYDDVGGGDYSKYIREIFGYDKRKFRYESDHEIANMTANFSQVMKEEARSARIGRQEDLEDIRKEEEELKRKALAKKKKK